MSGPATQTAPPTAPEPAPEPLGRLESTWVTVAGRRMHVRVSTDSPPSPLPVVLVHGLGVSSRYMIPTARRLAPYCRVFAPDLPGFGRSDRPAHALTFPELADALAGCVTALDVGPAAYLGNSLGCQTIVEFALRHRRLLSRAVLVGSTTDPQARSVLRQVARGVLDLFGESPSLWPILAYDYLTAGPLRTLRTLHYGVIDPLTAKLPHVDVPTLVVRGERDPIVPRQWAEEMARLLPNARLVELLGAPHAANYSAPAKLVAAVRPFLDV